MRENWRRYAVVRSIFRYSLRPKSPRARNVLASNYYHFLIKNFRIRKQQELANGDDGGVRVEYNVGDQPAIYQNNLDLFVACVRTYRRADVLYHTRHEPIFAMIWNNMKCNALAPDCKHARTHAHSSNAHAVESINSR